MSRVSKVGCKFWVLAGFVVAVAVIGLWAFVYPFLPFFHPGRVRINFSLEPGCSMKEARLNGSRLMMDARLVWARPGLRRFSGMLNGEHFEQDVEVPVSGGEMTISCEPPRVTIRSGR